MLSLLKIALMAALVMAAFALVRRAPPAAGALGGAHGPWPLRLATALVPCFYAYGGYHLTMNLGADLKDARRRFPLAIGAGVLTVVALYLLLNLAYQHALGAGGAADSPLVAAALTGALFEAAGKAVVSVVVFFSAAGFVNATIVHMPRTFYALAEDGALPPTLGKVNARTQAQEAGLLFFGATMLVPALVLGSFAKLLDYVILVDTVRLAVVASSLFVLRRGAQGEGGLAMRSYPLLPALYILCLLTVAVQVAVLQPALALGGGALLLTGWPLFRFGRRLSGTSARVSGS